MRSERDRRTLRENRARGVSRLAADPHRRHLERVLRVYVEHYNRERPHRALELRPPEPDEPPRGASAWDIRRRDRLGGLIHKYYRAAA